MLLKNLLKSYLRKLTNLTASNRSLVVLRLLEDSDLDLHSLEFTELNRTSFQILEQVLKSKRQIHLSDYIDSRDADVNKLSKKLSKIYHKCKLIEEERGAKDLFVGYPFVTGKFNDGSIVRCPLLFFPVELQLNTSKKGINEWVISPIQNELPFINRSFLLAYSHFNKVELNEDLLDFSIEEEFADSLSFRNWLYEFLKSSNLSINFNSELFQNELKPFHNFTKSSFEESFENGQLKLESQSILGIFPQSGSYLAPDYELWIDKMEEGSVEDFFAEKNISSRPVKEENILTAFPIDASQESAIVEIKSGKSMVVQGPPGTGKSQLISNLATDFASNGKRVLVVCQKRAALDVVHNRLSKIGLENFVALVHDFKADRKKLYDQLNTQIENIEPYKKQNAGFNAVLIEREFLHTCRAIGEAVEKLDSFKQALFDTKTFGVSAKELYLKSDPNQPFIDLTEKVSKLSYGDYERLLQKFSSLYDFAKIFERENFEWKNRVNFKGFEVVDFKAILEHIVEIESFSKSVNYSYLEILEFHDLQPTWGKWQISLKDSLGFEVVENIHLSKSKFNFKKVLEKIELLESLAETKLILFPSIDGAVQILQKVERALQFQSNFFSKTWYQVFDKENKEIRKLLNDNGLAISIENLEFLKAQISNGIQFTKSSDELVKILKLDSAVGFVFKENTPSIQIAKNSIVVAELIEKHGVLTSIFKNESKHWLTEFEKLIVDAKYLNSSNPKWRRYFTKDQLTKSFEDSNLPSALSKSITLHFDTLVAYDRLLSELSSVESSIFYASLVQINFVTASKSDFTNLVSNSIFISWLTILEQNQPMLKSTETFRLTQLEEELQQLVLKKQRLTTDIIQLKLKERIYTNNTFNRLNNRVTYRDLQHQLTKKKKIWKLRKVIENFNDEVFDLAPIWLVSPETVSAIFPFQSYFDLIIFDEASQCFSEKGFPAMFRGKQVVIAGDSKQLQPNDLYLPRFESESDADTDSELDSLLSIAQKYLRQTTLAGHYRSLLPELIGFSNEYFYENKLQILPEFGLMQSGKTPIHFVKTEGIWKDNSNLVEAEKILELTLSLLMTHEQKEIGIITFNTKQRDLIESLFEQYAIKFQFSFPEWLFIKNIENVQGDERDIILFSTAYAPDINGKMQMQFGSLNQMHGENRLNVAITRAKEEIYVVSSIWPEQLTIENTLNEGPKLLKKYLKYAKDISEGSFRHSLKRNEAFQQDWFLKNQLTAIDKNLQLFNLPFADLSKVKGNKIESLLLTDDEYFYNSTSSKDFFAYHPIALRNKNWIFERYFSRTFWKNQSGKRI